MSIVLVIDDEPMVRELLGSMLEQLGHTAVGKATLADALAYTASHRVDVVITDMFMPHGDGFDVIAAYRHRYPQVRIVAMTGGDMTYRESVLGMAECLGVATIKKPFAIDRLAAALRDAADGDLTGAPKAAGRPFLSFDLATPDTVRAMRTRIAETPVVLGLLDALPGMILLLNRQRQAVYANAAALQRLGIACLDDAIGRRPGELMHCIHAADDACGTTEFCRYCGTAQSLAGALRGRVAEQECRIVAEHAGGELNLRVTARPFVVGEDELLLLCVADIADEKRREALEATFFHDVLNTAGGIRGLCDLLRSATPAERDDMQQMLDTLSETLVDEIEQQRSLTLAERGELQVRFEPLVAGETLQAVAMHYRAHPVTRGSHIVVEPTATAISVDSDPTLLGRVLGNMLKNALEAVEPGSTVRLRAVEEGPRVRFEVWNPGVMPESAQRQVFQRSFSTKGGARGLGTYSMRLLTERYLGGVVSFESRADSGTVFKVTIPRTPSA